MIVFPNAKINLGLHILRKRLDGFHDLDTIFIPIPLFDILEVKTANFDTLELAGFVPQVMPEQNLVMQALFFLRNDFDIPACQVYLYKQIPIGAGLGGGSADAAFMLMLLNKKFNLKIGYQKLANYALQLGSDVPFFLENRILRATGRGNTFANVKVSLAGKWLLLVFPYIFVPTRIAFSEVKPINLPLVLPKDNEKWSNFLTNDFEKGVFFRHPLLLEIKENMYLNSAFYASMSGSGSCVFGIFNEKPTSLSINNDYFCRLIKL